MATVKKTDAASATRLRILDAAARLFRERGYGGTSQRDIAAACGMQAGSLYYHFASKEDVLAEVLELGIERPMEALKAALDELDESASPKERLHVAVRTHLHALFTQGDYTSAHFRIMHVAPMEVQSRSVAVRDEYETMWMTLLKDLKKAGELRGDVDLRIVRLFLIGGVNMTLDWYREGEYTLDQLADQYVDFMMNGIAAN